MGKDSKISNIHPIVQMIAKNFCGGNCYVILILINLYL